LVQIEATAVASTDAIHRAEEHASWNRTDRRRGAIVLAFARCVSLRAPAHICIEGWSMIGKWTGVPLRTFLERIGADLKAKYVGFECADGYYSSIDMASALHPQTLLTFRISDEILAPKYGFPLKLRIPTKLGFKNPNGSPRCS